MLASWSGRVLASRLAKVLAAWLLFCGRVRGCIGVLVFADWSAPFTSSVNS